MPIIKAPGYSLQLSSGSLNPVDGETQYYGNNASWTDIASIFRVYVPKAGTITRIDLNVLAAGVGSSESVSAYLRINNTTDVTISTAIDMSSILSNFSATPSQAISAGDYIEIKFVFPTFVTNPTLVFSNASVYVTT